MASQTSPTPSPSTPKTRSVADSRESTREKNNNDSDSNHVDDDNADMIAHERGDVLAPLVTTPKRTRSSSDEEGGDHERTHKRLKAESRSRLDHSSRHASKLEFEPAKRSPHPRFQNTFNLSILPDSNLCSALNTTDTDCSICLDPLACPAPEASSSVSTTATSTLVRHAQCAPLYHTACLERWAEEGSPTCPNCRGKLLRPALLQQRQQGPVVFADEEDNEVVGSVLGDLLATDILQGDPGLGLSDEDEEAVWGWFGGLVWAV